VSVLDDLRDFGLNFITGGIYGAVKAAAEAANRPGVVVPPPPIHPPAGTVPPIAPGVSAPGIPGINVANPCGGTVVAPPPPAVRPTAAGDCCCYVVEGNHLVNGRTGEVWLIDDKSRTLLPLRRRLSPVESAASAAGLSVAREALLQQKAVQLGQLHHSVQAPIAKHFDSMVKALSTEIDDLHRETEIK
jgi:hypothetical protein